MTDNEIITMLHQSGKSPFQAYKEAMGKLEVATRALKQYADETQWFANDHEPWKLQYDSGYIDGDGYAAAKYALQEINDKGYVDDPTRKA